MSTVQASFTFDDPTTIPDDITHHTTGSSMTSSSSRGVRFYFECAVLVIGIVGTAANGVVLYAMVASKQHQKQVLIFNQNLLDFFSCFSLAATSVLAERLAGKSGCKTTNRVSSAT